MKKKVVISFIVGVAAWLLVRLSLPGMGAPAHLVTAALAMVIVLLFPASVKKDKDE